MSQGPLVRLRWLPGELCVDVPRGEALMDAVDDQPAIQLPMACRAANCGTCRVRVIKGEAALVPADPWELDVLRRHEAGPDERLGCQLRFNHDTQCSEVTLERAF